MFLERVESEGLGHFSYLVGDGGEVAVIDPRRDCEVYLDLAERHDAQIRFIFETHRNEDYLVGSRDLAERTGAMVLHGSKLDWGYGNPVREGDRFDLGDVRLDVLETPGHTDESISIVLRDRSTGEDPLAVFTGDALFIGDVGRTDFYPDRPREVAGLLHDSIHGKLLPLGDHVELYPGHGAGSVCGAGMADRKTSTLGYERRNNPLLQLDREAFVERKVNERHYKPPYFEHVHAHNQKGPPVLRPLPRPLALGPDAFAEAMGEGMFVIDVRDVEAIAGGYVPSSLGLPLSQLSGFAGWFVPYDRDLGLVAHDVEQVEEATRRLIRMGYDRVRGFLAGGMKAWETSGRPFNTVGVIYIRDLDRRVRAREPLTVLDVRTIDEFEEGHLPGAKNVYLGELPDRLDEVPRDQPITTFCGSGRRSLVAATYLAQQGYEPVMDCLGSMAACKAVGCETVTEAA